jgi:hypothetical protein
MEDRLDYGAGRAGTGVHAPARAQETHSPEALPDQSHSEEHDASPTGLRVTRWANWLFRSFLQDETDDNDTHGIELESRLTTSRYEIKNISYFEINQYERGVPGQPPGNPEPAIQAADGIGDLAEEEALRCAPSGRPARPGGPDALPHWPRDVRAPAGSNAW